MAPALGERERPSPVSKTAPPRPGNGPTSPVFAWPARMYPHGRPWPCWRGYGPTSAAPVAMLASLEPPRHGPGPGRINFRSPARAPVSVSPASRRRGPPRPSPSLLSRMAARAGAWRARRPASINRPALSPASLSRTARARAGGQPGPRCTRRGVPVSPVSNRPAPSLSRRRAAAGPWRGADRPRSGRRQHGSPPVSKTAAARADRRRPVLPAPVPVSPSRAPVSNRRAGPETARQRLSRQRGPGHPPGRPWPSRAEFRPLATAPKAAVSMPQSRNSGLRSARGGLSR